MPKSDKGLVEKVARQFVACCGPDAVGYLHEQAELADAIGDELAAETWRYIRDVAERLSKRSAAD
jgi:hypothetical protein